MDTTTAKDAGDERKPAKSLAAKISNVVLTLVLLLALLILAPHFIQWWRIANAPTMLVKVPLTTFAAGEAVHELQFGASNFRLARQQLAIEDSKVADELARRCWASRQALPPDGEPGPSEVKLRERLLNQPPKQQDGEYRLYTLEEPLPMVTVWKVTNKPAESAPPARLVVWGNAQQVSPGHWIVYVWRTASAVASNEIPIPPDAQKTVDLALAEHTGPRMTGFQADSEYQGDRQTLARKWADYYTQWFAKHQWAGSGNWQPIDSTKKSETWVGSFENQQSNRAILIRIQVAGDSIRGLITETKKVPAGGSLEGN